MNLKTQTPGSAGLVVFLFWFVCLFSFRERNVLLSEQPQSDEVTGGGELTDGLCVPLDEQFGSVWPHAVVSQGGRRLETPTDLLTTRRCPVLQRISKENVQ